MKMNLKTVKDRLKDETLDLSLCELMEVPVREIVTIKKATHLDLSNNLLNSLPNNFVELKRIVKLDLSRNMLTEIPENFGELRQLKHLDLYANQISRLPLSLSELKNLRWLDLKENPLTPAVASVAGPCSNLSECQACARNVVTYLSCVKQSVEEEKLRRLNNATASAESDGATSKKAAKKKKKKQADKSNKDAGDKNETNQGKDTVKTGELKGNALKSPEDKKNKNKLSGYKGGSRSILGSLILWLFFLCLTAVFAVVILPLYFKQVDMFVNYIETNAGIPLKAFRKHSIDMLNAFLQNLVVVYDNLYKAYGEYFNKTIDIPVKN